MLDFHHLSRNLFRFWAGLLLTLGLTPGRRATPRRWRGPAWLAVLRLLTVLVLFVNSPVQAAVTLEQLDKTQPVVSPVRVAEAASTQPAGTTQPTAAQPARADAPVAPQAEAASNPAAVAPPFQPVAANEPSAPNAPARPAEPDSADAFGINADLSPLATGQILTTMAPGDNMVVNGSFEMGANALQQTQIPGWTVAAGAVDVWAGYLGSDGSNSILDLDGSPGPGTVEQTITGLAAGQTYYFEFDYSTNGNTTEKADVKVLNSSNVAIYSTVLTTPGDPNTLGWQPFRTTFSAPADGIVKLQFASQNFNGNASLGPQIDNVRVGRRLMNYVKNGSFELDTGIAANVTTNIPAWTVTAGNVDIWNGFYRPDGSAKELYLEGNTPGTVEQVVTGLTGGQTYTIEFEYSSENNSADQGTLTLLDSSAATVLTQAFNSTGDPNNRGWFTYRNTFTAPGDGQVTVRLQANNTNGNGTVGVIVDNVRIADQPWNFVKNGDFQAGPGGLNQNDIPHWTIVTGPVDIVDGAGGSLYGKAVDLNGSPGDGHLEQTITGLTPGALYVYQFNYAENHSSGTVVQFTTRLRDSANNSLLDRQLTCTIGQPNVGGWCTFRYTFTAPADGQVKIIFENDETDGNTTLGAWVDNIIISRDIDFVINGNFSSGPSALNQFNIPGWTIAAQVDMHNAYSGSEYGYTVDLNGTGEPTDATIQQNIVGLTPGQTYQWRYTYASTANNFQVQFNAKILTSAGAALVNVLQTTDQLPNVGGWKEGRHTFTAPADGKVQLIFQNVESDNNINYGALIDNVMLYGQVAQPVDINVCLGTVAMPISVAPGGVTSGLEVWVRSDKDVFTDNGTTAAANGNSVKQWNDQSGNAHHLIAPSTAGRYPTYYTTTAGQLTNFNPSLHFDGNDFMANNTRLMSSISPYSFMAVGVDEDTGTGYKKLMSSEDNFDIFGLYKQGGAPGDNGWIPYGVSGSPDRGDMGKGTKYSANGGANGFWNGTNFTSDNRTDHAQPQAVGFQSANSATSDPMFTWVDGYTENPGWSFIDENLVYRPQFFEHYALGADFNGGSGVEEWIGKINEAFVYNRVLSASEMARVNSYLALKWGITLGQGNGSVGNNGANYNYVDSTGATIWNATTNSGYGYDIAGIGRDDASALNQKQSQSVNTGFQPTIGLGVIAATNAANPNSFGADKSFLLWGDDNGSATFGTAYTPTSFTPPAPFYRMTRIWKVAETGTVGNVVVQGPASAEYLLVDTDGDGNFNTGSPTEVAMTGGSATFNFVHGQFFTFGKTGYAPGGVAANLKLWVKSDAGIAVSDGQTIPQWDNQADPTYNLTQGTAGNQPTYYTTTTGQLTNFNPSVHFDGTDDFIANNNRLMTSTGPYTFLTIGQDEDPSAGLFRKLISSEEFWDYFGLYKQGGAAGNNGWVPYGIFGSPDYGNMGKGTKYSVAGGANGYYNGVNFTSDARTDHAQPQAVGFMSQNNVVNAPMFTWVDGYTEDSGWSFTDDGIPPATRYFENYALGADYDGTNGVEVWKGKINESIVYDRVLTATEMARVNSYLALKWGITLGQGNGHVGRNGNNYNYVDSGAATIWDATTNSGYGYDIAGIGRDDPSQLNQKQSASVNLNNLVTIGLGTIAATNAANPNTFSADKSFLIWGHNNATTTVATVVNKAAAATVINAPNITRMARIWKVQETGTVGNVRVRIPASALSLASTDLGWLIVSNDTTFDGTDTFIPLVTNGSNLENTVNFTTGQYFTFARQTLVDTDGDGVPDSTDLDDDNDGIPDTSEGSCSVDTDGDGVPDCRDLDSDNDGIDDVVEAGGVDADKNGQLDCPGVGVGVLNIAINTTSGAIDITNLNAQGTAGFTDFQIGALEGANLRVFQEQSLVLGAPLDVDVFVPAPSGSPFTAAGSSPFKIPAGSLVRSFLVHWDAVGPTGGAVGTITFDTPIYAIEYLWHDLNPSDFLDNGTNIYYTGGVRGSTEFDTITISPDRLTITINLFVLGYVDELRILFVDPTPQPKPADNNNNGLLKCVDPAEGGAALSLPDTDGDGIKDFRDLDSDNDTIGDLIEGGSGAKDLDNNGVVDGPDVDGDGIQDSVDGFAGFGDANSPTLPNLDGDSLPDYRDVDSDGDSTMDITEAGNGALDGNNDGKVDNAADADGDGAADVADTNDAAFGYLGVPPALVGVDTDGDGVPDYLDADDDNDGILDTVEGSADPDGDGIPNSRDLDSDNDGINDAREGGITDCNYDEVITNNDANGDGMVDGGDADGDGVRSSVDPDEGGCDALVPDSDGDGIPDFLDLDSDNDTVSDLVEGGSGATDANNNGVADGPDADGDGIVDSADGNDALFGDSGDPLPTNTDGDNFPDYTDKDSDNDSAFDIVESGNPALDTNGDGRVDNPADADADGIPNSADNNDAVFGGLPFPPTTLTSAPGGVTTSLRAWYKANSGIAVANGVDVITWSEETGAFDATGGDPSARPTFRTNGGTASFNFNPFVDFDSNDWLATGNGMLGATDQVEVFVVASPQETIGQPFGGDIIAWDDNSTLTLEGDTPEFFDTNTAIGLWFTGPSTVVSNATPRSTGRGYLYSLAWSQTATPRNELAVDAGTPATGATTPANNGTFETIMGSYATDNNAIDFNVAEIVVYTTRFAGNERSRIQSYLALKYGITLDQTAPQNYVASDGTTIPWNATTNTGYNNNIAGIGRDDASVLTQRQSKSVNTGLQVTVGNGTIAATNATNPNNFGFDKSFLMWGDDNGSTTVGTAVPGLNAGQRMARLWKAQETGTVGTVMVSIPTSAITLGSGEVAYLFRSVDTTINSSDTVVLMTLNGSNYEATIDFASGDFFTFGKAQADLDGDGVADPTDQDDDNDGIPDTVEDSGVVDPDGDGIPNSRDLDSDNDGINDVREAGGLTDANGDGMADGTDGDNDGMIDSPQNTPVDTDGDGKPDYRDLDSDNDGWSDLVESGQPGVIDANNDGVVDGPDADGDGIRDSADGNDALFGDSGDPAPTNTDGTGGPDYIDTDADGDATDDIDEGGMGSLDANNDGMIDNTADPEGDGIPNVIDTQDAAFGGLPSPLADSDGDGIPNGVEGNGTVDTDGDGIPDSSDKDSDNDGIPDSVEGAGDTDGDGIPDYRDLDSDNDGINDVREAGGLTDANGDGKADGTDGNNDGMIDTPQNTPVDTDGDGRPDTRDLDSDNDSINDVREAGGLTDANGDGKADGPDTDGDGIPDSADGLNGFGDSGDTAPVDSDGDGKRDYRDLDSDNDGLSDLRESGSGATDANNDGVVDGPDADNDGIRDSADGNDALFGDSGDTAPADTDGTGGPDYIDRDSDGDTVDDIDEAGLGVLDADNDGRIDNTVDADGDGAADIVDQNDAAFGGLPFPPVAPTDTDGDGVIDASDADDDGDGIPDITEGNGTVDTDGDGIPDSLDLDSDNDGINDVREAGGLTDANGDGKADGTDANNDGVIDSPQNSPVDTDGDGKPDYRDLDSDNDGVSDLVEGGSGATDANDDGVADGPDADGDGIVDSADGNDALFGDSGDTAPTDTDGTGGPDYIDLDSDGDAIDDIDEAGLGVLDANNDGMIDNTADPEGDGVPNVVDTADATFGGLPNPFGDTDGDGIPNNVEGNGTVDTDGDGIPDSSDKDSDNDGIPDSVEVGPNPATPRDTDGDGIPDYRDLDSDNDGINDVREAGGLTDANGDGKADGTDGNGDGMIDSPQTNPVDTDGDGKPDYRDLDSDNDGVSDLVEGGSGATDANDDGVADGPDADGDGIVDSADGNDALFGDSGDTAPTNTDGTGGPDYIDTDADGDAIDDIDEAGYSALDANNDGMIDNTADPEGDGIPNVVDTADATFGGLPNPFGDTDGDGIPNNVEGNGAVDTDGDGIPDSSDKDSDGDGIPDSVEGAGDTDGDGIPDYRDLDSDNDGINDVREAGGLTDANGDGKADGTDGNNDGMIDSPQPNPVDTDGDGADDYVDLDSDNDGVSDLVEGGSGATDANNDGEADGPDADGDGIVNSADGLNGFGDASDPAPANPDGDGQPSYLDRDSDGDTIDDIDEAGYSALDGNNDGKIDAPADADGDGAADVVDTNDAVFGGLPNPFGDADGDGIPDNVEGNGTVDTDGDGIPDSSDKDSDNDGIPDSVEGAGDTDGDGVPNFRDLDSDNDGINDVREAGGLTDANGDGKADGTDGNGDGMIDSPQTNPVDTDGDGRPDYVDLDSDNDGVSDLVEGGSGATDANNDGVADGPDSDGDGIVDSADGNDALFGDASDPAPTNTDGTGGPDYLDTDADGDGTDDIDEAGLGVLDANNDGRIDNTSDPEGDGVPNIVDTNDGAFGGLPNPYGDSDGDGIPNNVEGNGTVDTDGDGIPDSSDRDSDNDGIPDSVEVGPNPTTPRDTDGDGVPDYRDLDSDNDGINDVREAGGLTDANGDGKADGTDGNGDGMIDTPQPNPVDTDGDGTPDYRDLDSDNDGVSDLIEGGSGATDANNDGEVDGPDSDGDGIQNSADGLNGFGDASDPAPTNTDGTGGPDYIDTDADGDGTDDIDEAGLGALDGNNDGKVDNAADADGDGAADVVDTNDAVFGGLPSPFGDSDGDGIPNNVEGNGTVDTDGDGIPDSSDKDSDNDGIPDSVEGVVDTDGDGKPDYRDLDSDNDGINDVREAGGLTDANGDGKADGTDGNGDGMIDTPQNLPIDSDSDGKPDYRDLDSDNDGWSDLVESGQPGVVDANNDGVVDGPDADGDGIRDSADGNDALFGDSGDPAPTNTDGTGGPDYIDLDSDGDATDDIDEGGMGVLDANNDGMIDNTADPEGDGVPNVVDTADATFGGLPSPLADDDGDGIPNGVEGNGTVDTDGDGIPDSSDKDSDNDGIPDSVEVGPNPTTPRDTDGDGVPDYRDLDSDNDGINDVREAGGLTDANGDGKADGTDGNGDGMIDSPQTNPVDSDGDGRPDYRDLDSDNDGVSDLIEGGSGATDANNDGVADGPDSDGDGIVNSADGLNGFGDSGDPAPANPDGDGQPSYLDRDSDGDTVDDIDEAGLSPLDANNDGKIDAPADADGDGAADVVDTNDAVFGGLPNPFADNDGDGIPNGQEGNGTVDTDGDGIPDSSDKDSDGDGIPDSVEGAGDTDGDGIPNYRDLDSDNDGINDVREAGGLTDANGDGKADGTDGNGDGMIDSPQTNPVDTDGDGRRDYVDLDSDNDAISDLVEGGSGATDANNDGVADGPDSDGDGIQNSADGLNGFGDSGDPAPTNTDGTGGPDYIDTDADGDGTDDIDEAGMGALDANNDGRIDNTADPEGDGIPNVADTNDGAFGGLPNPFGDDDGDGIPNGVEGNGTVDTDGDGIPDSSDKDSDNDGIPDSVEVGPNPTTPRDTDGDGVPDYRDLDSDNDGINDVREAGGLTDANGDGKADGTDGNGDGMIDSPQNSPVDSDGDGRPDYRDLDSDNDSISDLVESGVGGLTDANNDGVVDGPDSDGDGIQNSADGLNGFGDSGDAAPANTDGTGAPDYLDTDADGDGTDDIDEVGNGAFDANNDGKVDNPADADNDGAADVVDTNDAVFGGLPSPYGDTDGDGIPNNIEGTVDTDGDGIPDSSDKDSDNDGIPDSVEGAGDTDGDGIPNYRDLDSDNDGINDVREAGGLTDANGDGKADGTDGNGDGMIDNPQTNPVDSDGDGKPDYRDLDSDNDGVSDLIESGTPGLADANDDGVVDGPDSDGDGIRDSADGNDALFGDSGDTAPTNTDGTGGPDYIDRDADGDGTDDIDEAGLGNLDANNDGKVDNPADADNDGAADVVDSNDAVFGGLKNPYGDDDGDGIPNGVEGNGSVDTDGDGIPDSSDKDSDNDGIPDSVEVGPNPTTPRDTDGDGVPDYRDLDSDNDGINDVREAGGLTDANGDGKADGTDGNGDGMIDTPQPNPVDTDGDGVPDYRDLDSDNDTVSDLVEGGSGATDANNDGEADGPDSDGDGIVDSADGVDNAFGDSGDTAPTNTDGTGGPDYIDRDSDGDGIDDIDEAGNGGLDGNNDGKVDNTTDADGDGAADVVDTNDGAFGGLPNPYGDDDGDGINNGQEGNGTVDTDGDGIPDSSDADSDGDGIPDSVEGAGDTDGDGVPDYRDLDSDNDGINDVREAGGLTDANGDGKADGTDGNGDGMIDSPQTNPVDTDGDGTPDYVDLDSDNDTVSDLVEGGSGATDANNDGEADGPDSDGDGIVDSADGVDNAFGDSGDTAPTNTDGTGAPDYLDTDADGDGTDDIDEAGNGGLDGNNDGKVDNTTDSDGDGVPNVIDNNDAAFGGLPNPYGDDDGDGIPNGVEGNGTVDTDGDGIPDSSDADSDNDGIPDSVEVGPNPTTPRDTDGDGVPDYRDLDSDNDGINDVREAGGLTDANGDGKADGTDGNGDGMIDTPQPNPVDTDGDGVPDYRDLDSDNDTVSDLVEGGSGATDANNDGEADGPDSDGDGIVDSADGVDNAFGDSGDTAPANTDGTGGPDYIDRDSDGDGTDDIDEAGNSGLDGNNDGKVDNSADSDGDGAPNVIDNNDGAFGGLPNPYADSDGDGINDGQEGNGTVDTDGDGVPDSSDADSDNDGIPDSVEGAGDTDGDGVPDYRDLDSDNDGINDVREAGGLTDANGDGKADGTDGNGDGMIDSPQNSPVDTDGDGTPDYVDLDSDNDTVSDLVEGGSGATDANNDGEADGPDSDGDGIQNSADGVDNAFGDSGDTAPANTDGTGAPDYIDRDADGDGTDDIDEAGNSGLDTDNDGKVDNSTDSDGDGAADVVDTNDNGFGGLPAPAGPDSDGDGIPDGVECPGGTNCPDTDGDGTPNKDDIDDDNDGVPTTTECPVFAKSAALQVCSDSDNDGVPNYLEPNNEDTDGDGRPNSNDSDDDGDGIPTQNELGPGGPLHPADTDGDGRPDYLDDDSTGQTCDPAPRVGANYYQLPVLGYIGNTATGVDWVIEAQNVGATWTKIALLLFAENQGFCQPQVAAPFKLECTGLLKPGASWIWTSQQVSRAAKSAIAFSYNPFPAYNRDYYRCENIDVLRRTAAWPEGWPGVSPTPGAFPFNWNPFLGEPIAVEVVRKAPGNTNPSMVMSAAYSGVSAKGDGRYDPVFGGFAYYAPVVYSGFLGFNSWLYIQNSGAECSSVELWFKAQDDCLRAQVCEVLQLSPGYTAQFNVSSCVPPGFVGSVWIRASQPLGIVVDQIGANVLMSYTGTPAELCFIFNGQCLDQGGGSLVAYGPLIYREQQGWDTRVYVQNLSSIVAAKVKVYFVDHSGGIITTLVDWVCPRGEQTFFLPLVNNLPGNYVGAIRVESQAWESPGDPFVNAVPIAAVAELIQYSSPARTTPLQAIAYNLFPQEQAYIWQIGAGAGGLESGVAVIGIPSLLQRGNSLGIQTELAIQNVVPKPGFTDFAIFVYDQNGLIDFVCEKLNEKQVEYIDLSTWGWVQPGFKGSAVISATFWEHDVFAGDGGFIRNVVGLAALKIERVVPSANIPIPGDLAAGSEGFPIPGDLGRCPSFDFEGFPPVCPGVPANCADVKLVVVICPPNTSTRISTYSGARVELYNWVNQLHAWGTVQPNGKVDFFADSAVLVVSGNPYRVVVKPVLQPVPFPAPGGEFIEMAGFTHNVVVPCVNVPYAGGPVTPNVVELSITPPPGVIEGYYVNACNQLNIPRGGREIQLWIPPQNPQNQGGTYLTSYTTTTEGFFQFLGVNPCLVYELKEVVGSVTTVTVGVLAGAETTTIGTPGVGQKYIIAEVASTGFPAGAICDVLPNPP